MGDAKSGRVRLSFDPQFRVEFRGATVTSDAKVYEAWPDYRARREELGLTGS